MDEWIRSSIVMDTSNCKSLVSISPGVILLLRFSTLILCLEDMVVLDLGGH